MKLFANTMNKIDPSELIEKEYAEANDWDHDFGKAYGWPNLILALAFFTGVLLVFRGHTTLGGLNMLASLVVILVLWCFFRHSKPVSPITGKMLTPYLSTNPRPRNPYDPDASPIVEMIYVDHDSKRFFRHVFLENDPIRSG